jgi:predicted secreted protein
MKIHGKNIILTSSTTGVAFAMAKSCDLDVRCGTIEVSSYEAGAWEHAIADKKSWSVHLSHLVGNIKSNAQMVGQTVNITLSVVGVSGDTLSGSAIIEEWKVTATKGNLAQGSFSLRGTGALT